MEIQLKHAIILIMLFFWLLLLLAEHNELLKCASILMAFNYTLLICVFRISNIFPFSRHLTRETRKSVLLNLILNRERERRME